MESGENEGEGQEERKEAPTQDEKDNEAPGEPAEAGDDLAVTVPPVQEVTLSPNTQFIGSRCTFIDVKVGVFSVSSLCQGVSEEPSDRDRPDSHSNSGESDTEAVFIALNTPGWYQRSCCG